MPHAPHRLDHTPVTAALLDLIRGLAPDLAPTLTLALRRETAAVLTAALSHPLRGAAVIPHPALVLVHARGLLSAAANVLHTVGLDLDLEHHPIVPDPVHSLHLDGLEDVLTIHVAQVGAGLGRSPHHVVGKLRTAGATGATQDLHLGH